MNPFSLFLNLVNIDCAKFAKVRDFVDNIVMCYMKPPVSQQEKEADQNEKYYPFDQLQVDTVEKIYSGKISPSKRYLRRLHDNPDPNHFAAYINSFSEESKYKLEEDLRTKFPDFNGDVDANLGYRCFDLFTKIIDHMLGLDNTASSLPIQTNLFDSKQIEKNDMHAAISKYIVNLIAECHGICPCENCSTPLGTNYNSQGSPNCTVVKINPALPPTYDNLIALCPNCANKYLAEATPSSIQKMRNIKMSLMSIVALMQNAEKISETNIREIVETVNKNISQEHAALNFNPAKLSEKILPSNVILRITATALVTSFFPIVRSTLQQMSREGKLDFEAFSMKIRLEYKRYKKKGLSQDQIFSEMINWLVNMSNGNPVTCQVIIAFFIQDCEVFDATPEQAV